MTKKPREVLKYTKERKPSGTVRRHYLKWRKEQGIPDRCDNSACVFYTQPLEWNDKQLTPILDHKNGVKGDDRPKNLRLLCPNCDAQLETRGGGNKGRVISSGGGFAHVDKQSGKRAYTMPVEPGHFKMSLSNVRLKKAK